MTREAIVEEIKAINRKLPEIYNAIVMENMDGKQFDYVNSPELSDAVDVLWKWAEKIEKVVYQKTVKN